MKSPVRATILVVMSMLLAWHGVLLTTPHHHADSAVPQEELDCPASRPSSQTNHLHGSGRLLSPHPCVACLVGSTVAEVPGIAAIQGAAVGASVAVALSSDLRARLHSHLPLLRGPPLTT